MLEKLYTPIGMYGKSNYDNYYCRASSSYEKKKRHSGWPNSSLNYYEIIIKI